MTGWSRGPIVPDRRRSGTDHGSVPRRFPSGSIRLLIRCLQYRLEARVPDAYNLLVAQGLQFAVSMAIGLGTAAILEPSAKGIAALAIAIATVGGATSFLSLHVGVVHATGNGDKAAAARAVWIAAMVGGALALGGLMTVVVTGGSRVTGENGTLALGLVAIVVDAPTLVVLRTIQGLGKATRYRVGTAVRLAAYGCTIVGFAGAASLTPREVVISFIVGDVVGVTYGSYALHETIRAQPRQYGRRDRTPILGRSLRAHFALLSQQVLYRGDVLVLGALSAPSQVGQYSVATSVAETLWVVTEAISLSMYASTVRAQREDRHDVARALLRRALATNLALCSVGGVLVVGAGYVGLTYLLPSYHRAFWLMVILLPGVIIGGSARILTSAAIGADRRTVIRIAGASSVVSATGYLPAIWIGGSIGAALATDGLYVILTLTLLIAIRRSEPRLEHAV